jgi:hypothetical protein
MIKIFGFCYATDRPTDSTVKRYRNTTMQIFVKQIQENNGINLTYCGKEKLCV